MKPIRLCALLLAFCVLPAAGVPAAVLEVGQSPVHPYARIEDALAKAQPGDTILVFGNAQDVPYEKTAILVTKPRIIFKGAPSKPTILTDVGGGGRVPLSGKGFDYTGAGSVPRAIFQFNPGADGCVLEGFDLFGAHNESHNGSGVRINQANNVTIRNCRIHGNDMGIMSNGDGTPKTAVNQLIESCLIHSNGDLTDPGYNHNLYLGGTSVTLLGCEVRGSLTGHNVKSRAHLTVVAGCYIHDSSNREFDLVDAKGDTTAPDSNALLVGNVIVKNPTCEGNKNVIHFGQDGGNEHDGTLTLINNTIVTPFLSPVVALDAPKARAVFLNNLLWDNDSYQNGHKLVDTGKAGKEAAKGAANWMTTKFSAEADDLGWTETDVPKPHDPPPFVKAAKGDYRLSWSLAQGKAIDPKLLAPLGGKLYQFKAPLGYEERRLVDKPDFGAYAFAPAGKAAP
jgi:hypothetical protein